MVGSSTTYYFELSMFYVAIPQHNPLSLYTQLVGPSIANLDFHFPWYNLWMVSKGSNIFMVMALGPCVNWLSCGFSCHHIQVITNNYPLMNM